MDSAVGIVFDNHKKLLLVKRRGSCLGLSWKRYWKGRNT